MTDAETVKDIIDKALLIGSEDKLASEEIACMIKVLMVDEFGSDAPRKLRSIGLKIAKDDKDGIEKANKILDKMFTEIVGDLDNA